MGTCNDLHFLLIRPKWQSPPLDHLVFILYGSLFTIKAHLSEWIKRCWMEDGDVSQAVLTIDTSSIFSLFKPLWSFWPQTRITTIMRCHKQMSRWPPLTPWHVCMERHVTSAVQHTRNVGALHDQWPTAGKVFLWMLLCLMPHDKLPWANVQDINKLISSNYFLDNEDSLETLIN